MRNLPSDVANCMAAARQIHMNDRRRDGSPYFDHLHRTMSMVDSLGGTTTQRCVALLHDAFEDHPEMTIQVCDAFGIGNHILKLAFAMAKIRNEDYVVYIERLRAAHPELVLVKICDIVDNLTDSPTPKQRAKYINALAKLTR